MAGFDLSQIVGVLGDSGMPGAIPGAGAMPQQAGSGLSLEGLFGDPNFISFLAGTGAALDPNGVGGAVGKATQSMVQNQQMGKAMEKQDKRWSAFIEAMGKGQVGSVSIKEDPKGGTSISMKAPEGGLGSLDKPVQSNVPMQPVSPLQQYMNDIDGWMKKYGGM